MYQVQQGCYCILLETNLVLASLSPVSKVSQLDVTYSLSNLHLTCKY